MNAITTDFLIIGGGIMGLATARTLRREHPNASIIIIEKEPEVGLHASGRNSGVLHAGFYYTADSLKARFCRDGNRALRAYCLENKLRLNECKKLVVAKSPDEEAGLKELERRGKANGVEIELITEREAEAIEPNVRTHGHALYSPTTATVDPADICLHLRKELAQGGVQFFMRHPYQKRMGGNKVLAGSKVFEAGRIVNCAGLYADKIAKDFGFCQDYTIIPFKGIYLRFEGATAPTSTNLYCVPNLKNPFLGVHFGITGSGVVRIGPTAIPAFWRENYTGLSNIRLDELASIMGWEALLFARNAFGFRSLAMEEMKKYWRPHLLALAGKLVKKLNPDDFRHWSRPGIRAQLLNTKTLSLVQDFIVEGDAQSTHVLNAVSPAFTSSFPFADWMVAERMR
jgi:L-2-hydroxyglutarate oxidase LhgO